MLHVFHSNQVERLIEALTANIHQIRAANTNTNNIFETIEVVIPNWNLETYIKFQIAQRTGIAANLRFRTLENFLTSCIKPAPNTPNQPEIQIVSDKTITLVLIDLLSDENFLNHPELTPIKSYLKAANSHSSTTQTTFQKTDSATLRKFQLASQLAKSFREYDYARQEMLLRWPQENTIEKAPFDQVERWQRHLWLAIFGPEGILTQLGQENQKQYLRLSQLFSNTDPNTEKIQLNLPQHTHIFGLSYVAPLFEKIFTQFKSRPEGIYFYTLNPCEAFWEDVQPGNDEEDDNGLTSITGLFDYERDTPALRRWGRPGRDNTRMLNRLSENVHETQFFADLTDQALSEDFPQDLTLLQTLQEDIRQRAPERTPPPPNTQFDDDSIQFLACPSIQREAEIVANEIWHLIEKSDGTLRFNDIAVIVNHAQRDLYQTHIRAAFKDTHAIAHNISDIAATTRFRVFEAVELLFSLPFGDFRRRELLKLITHPNVIAGPSIPADIDPEQWINWCNELNILHGAHHQDHADTYIKSDLYNWDQGMRRLTLGAFMSQSSTHASATNAIFTNAEQHHYIPLEHTNNDLESSASLITLVRGLIADAQFCQTTELPLADWATLMSHMLTTYLGKSEKTDTAELLRCHQKLAEIRQLDITHEPVPYRVAYQFMRQELDALETQSGQYLVDGVVVTSFLPMRPIPFKVVFVTGMGEGKSPVTERQNPLDLRLAHWREGDVKSRDQDKYMFLETLISTRENLYLSWVSRDNRTGDPLEPSSVVKELQYILLGYESPEKLAKRFTEHPLRRFDKAYFPKFYDDTTPPKPLAAYGQEARQEAILKALHNNLQTFTANNNLDFPDPRKLQQYLAPETWENIQTHLKSVDPPPTSTLTTERIKEPPTRISLPIRALFRFLECPLQASARYVANLYDYADPDLFAAENERFETERFPQRILLTDVFLQFAATPDATTNTSTENLALQDIYDAHAQRLELLGILPTGLFKDAERGRHLSVLAMWNQNLQTFGLDLQKSKTNLQSLRFGRPANPHQANTHLNPHLYPAIRLNLSAVPQADGTTRDFQVDLVGESQAISSQRNLSISLINRKSTDTRDFLPGFFDHVLLAASGLLPKRFNPNATHTVFLNPTETLSKTQSKTRVFHPMTQQEALDYLSLLTRDLLSGIHDYLLPIEAVTYFSDPRNQDAFAEIVANLLEQNKSISSLYGPVRRLELFQPPNEEIAKTIINNRFAPFLKSVEEVEA